MPEKIAALERENARLREQLARLSGANSTRGTRVSADLPEPLKTEAHYRALIELSPQVIWMTDASGGTTYTNRHWFDYTGLSAEQTLGEGWVSALHPSDAEAAYFQWKQAVAADAPYENEIRIRRAIDGEYRWHLTRALPVRDETGKVAHWIGIAVDIHDRKKASAELAEADERLRLAVESAGMGTFDYYPDTNETKWSERASKILG
ncbi:MAG TPA: PAS domain-containing protein, partial [Candidatus Limnocylindrales bacterium]|nr:PAS domain-containing protein [Candidatus Limnocylindrales bacterium]